MSEMEWPPMGFFLQEVAEVYHDWHATEGSVQFVVLGLIHIPSRAAAMKAAEEQEVIQVRANHTDFLQMPVSCRLGEC